MGKDVPAISDKVPLTTGDPVDAECLPGEDDSSWAADAGPGDPAPASAQARQGAIAIAAEHAIVRTLGKCPIMILRCMVSGVSFKSLSNIRARQALARGGEPRRSTAQSG